MSSYQSEKDKEIERARYNNRANVLKTNFHNKYLTRGSQSIRVALRSPYILYEKLIETHVDKSMHALELGAGTGNHTLCILETGARTTASDLSEVSLQILNNRYSSFAQQLETCHADMEQLPFENDSFDVVTSAGSLSYGDPDTVRREILRVLKPNGMFICVDSLKANPIYSLNRWVHFLKGRRSLSTLKRMPNMRVIDSYRAEFQETNVYYFGALSFLVPILSKLLGEKRSATFLDRTDYFLKTKRMAFKFVMYARKRTHPHGE